MDVMAMKRQGLSIKEIAEETGYHPSTISGWLQQRRADREAVERRPGGDRRALGGPDRRAGAGRTAPAGHQRVRADQGRGLCRLLCRAWPGTSTTLRGPRFTAAPAASTRIVTAPGEECQFDWSDVSHWTREWGLGEIQCFSAILSLVPDADLVVRPLHRPRVHLRGTGAVLRVRRRCAQGPAHRPDGSPRPVPGSAVHASTRRRLASPSSTAPRSGPARPGTPSARARSNAPSVT